MTFAIQHDHDVYCWLRLSLEPRYRVVAEPQPGYFAQWLYCYRIFDQTTLVKELSGDLRCVEPGALTQLAQQIVTELTHPELGRRRC